MPSRRGLSILRLLWIGGLLYAAASPALAETIYEWTDEAGNIRYGDAPPAGVSYRIVSDDAEESVPAALDAEAEGPAEYAPEPQTSTIELDGPSRTVTLTLPDGWLELNVDSTQKLVELNPWVDVVFSYERARGERPTLLLVGDQPAGLLPRSTLEKLRSDPERLNSFVAALIDKLGATFKSAQYDLENDVLWCDAAAGELDLQLAHIPTATGLLILSTLYVPSAGPATRTALRGIVESHVLSPDLRYPAASAPETAASSPGTRTPPQRSGLLEALHAEKRALYQGDLGRTSTWGGVLFALLVVGVLARKRSRRKPRRLA